MHALKLYTPPPAHYSYINNMKTDLRVKRRPSGNSLAVQWVRVCASTAGGEGTIPGWGTMILHAAQCGQKKKRERERERWPSIPLFNMKEAKFFGEVTRWD